MSKDKFNNWLQDLIEGTEKSMAQNLEILERMMKRGNTQTNEFSQIIIGLRDDERDLALISLIKESYLEEVSSKKTSTTGGKN